MRASPPSPGGQDGPTAPSGFLPTGCVRLPRGAKRKTDGVRVLAAQAAAMSAELGAKAGSAGEARWAIRVRAHARPSMIAGHVTE